MNTKAVAAVVIVFVILGLGYFAYQRKASVNTIPQVQNTASVVPSESPKESSSSAGVNELIVSLSEQNNSSQSGTAKLTSINGKTQVSISVTGGNFTTPQPAHIHAGACPTPGAVKYPLTTVVNGKSDTTIDVSLADLLKQLPLAVNIHKSAAATNVYTACGDVKTP